jgi:choline-glycine betaine transporter
VAEPLYHLSDPPLGTEEPGTTEAARLGLQFTVFHWGLHPWAMYAVMGMALAYGVFRKGRPSLVSSAVIPLVGEHRPVCGERSTPSRSSPPSSARPPRSASVRCRSTAAWR